MAKGATEFEDTLMGLFLEGDHLVLEYLRRQYENASIVSREFSGTGFFTDYTVSSGLAIPGKHSFVLGDVAGEICGLKYGAGFLVFVNDGCLSMLEGYSYEEAWPNEITSYSLLYNTYRQVDSRTFNIISRGKSRDMDNLLRVLPSSDTISPQKS